MRPLGLPALVLPGHGWAVQRGDNDALLKDESGRSAVLDDISEVPALLEARLHDDPVL